MTTFFYPASFLEHKNHSLLNHPFVTKYLKSHAITIYLTISPSDFIFDSSNLTLLGRLPHKSCMELLEQSSALLFLSSFESLGLPLIEATQLNKPVICPDLPYSRELLGDSAYFFADQSPESLCAAFTRFLSCDAVPIISQLISPLHSIEYAWNQFICKDSHY